MFRNKLTFALGEVTAGAYAGERPLGRAANRRHRASQANRRRDGPAQWGGGEARPKSAGKVRVEEGG
jgi:hypothetical protein